MTLEGHLSSNPPKDPLVILVHFMSPAYDLGAPTPIFNVETNGCDRPIEDLVRNMKKALWVSNDMKYC